MQNLSIVRRTVRGLRWQVWWYGFGLATLAALVVYIFPSYREELASFHIPEALKAMMGNASYATANGFLTGEFFSWAPLLGTVFAIMAGTAALGSEESSGTLELLLSQPISRKNVMLQKMAGLALGASALVLLICLGWLVSLPFVDIEISLSRVLLATFLMLPAMLLVAALALFATAILPDRRTATGLVTAICVASFFVNYLAALVSALSPLRWLSVFHYTNSNVLTVGFRPLDLCVVCLATLGLSILAVIAFDKREIGIHAPLRLPRILGHAAKPRHLDDGRVGLRPIDGTPSASHG